MGVLFDTNIWRYLVDADAIGRVRQLRRRRKLIVALPPATAFEVARTGEPEVRRALVRAICHPEWKRLMPEGYTMSMEIVEEVRRCRPHWMLAKADKHRFMPLFRDWRSKSGFWRRLEEQPDAFADVLREADWDILHGARAQAYGRRQEFIGYKLTKSGHLDKWLGEFPSPREGWDGDKVDAWRLESFTAKTYALSRSRGPFWDWISCYVDLARVDLNGPDWLRFWLYDCQRDRLKLQWLCGRQRFFKVSAHRRTGIRQTYNWFSTSLSAMSSSQPTRALRGS